MNKELWEGLDMVFWQESGDIFVEFLSGESRAWGASGVSNPKDTGSKFALTVDFADFLSAIPKEFSYGIVQDNGILAKILQNPLQ